MKPIPLLIAFLLTGTALADGGSSRLGGGGNAVVCLDDPNIVATIANTSQDSRQIPASAIPHIRSLKMLDLLEAEFDTSLAPEFLETLEGESPQAFAQRAIDRLGDSFPALRQNLLSRLDRLQQGFLSINDPSLAGVRLIEDLGPVRYQIDRSTCLVATVAIQYERAGVLNLIIDDRLMSNTSHSALSRGTLWVHEVIYNWARELGQTDSFATRMLVGLLIRQDLDPSRIYNVVTTEFLKPGAGTSDIGQTLGLAPTFEADLAQRIEPVARTHYLVLLDSLRKSEFSPAGITVGDDSSWPSQVEAQLDSRRAQASSQVDQLQSRFCTADRPEFWDPLAGNFSGSRTDCQKYASQLSYWSSTGRRTTQEHAQQELIRLQAEMAQSQTSLSEVLSQVAQLDQLSNRLPSLELELLTTLEADLKMLLADQTGVLGEFTASYLTVLKSLPTTQGEDLALNGAQDPSTFGELIKQLWAATN